MPAFNTAAFTTLAFYRSKQTVASFADIRPKSLTAVHQAARDGLQEVLNHLNQMERIFLNQFTSYEEMAQYYLPTIRRLLPLAGQRNIARKFDFELICERVKFNTNQVYNEQIELLRELGSHINDSNPAAFDPVISEVEAIAACLDRFCLSFGPGTKHGGPSISGAYLDPQLETIFSYDKQRIERMQQIKDVLWSIQEKAKAYSMRGINFSHFSVSTVQLFRRVDCTTSPFFMLFPESCELIREAVDILKRWVDEDAEYPEALKADVQRLSKEENTLTLQCRDINDQLNKLRFRLQMLSQEVEEEQKIHIAQQAKLLQIQDNEMDAMVEYKKAETVVNKATYCLQEINSRKSEYSDREYRVAVAEQNRIIDDAKKMMPQYTRIQLRANEKMDVLKTRSVQFGEHKKELKELEKEEKAMNKNLKKMLSTLENTSRNLVLLRSVYKVKFCNSTIKKLFHHLPISQSLAIDVPSLLTSPRRGVQNQTQSSDTSSTKRDNLSKAMRITARLIEKDWRKLYFSLPFHPLRGKADIESDVDKIDKRLVRGSRFEMCMEALESWRRLDNRANLPALKAALTFIGRGNIVRVIEARLGTDDEDADGTQESLQARREALAASKLPPISPITRLIQRQRQLLADETLVKQVGKYNSLTMSSDTSFGMLVM